MSPLYDEFGNVVNRRMLKPEVERDPLAQIVAAQSLKPTLDAMLRANRAFERMREPRVLAANGDRLTRADVGLAPTPPMGGGRSIIVPLEWKEAKP